MTLAEVPGPRPGMMLLVNPMSPASGSSRSRLVRIALVAVLLVAVGA